MTPICEDDADNALIPTTRAQFHPDYFFGLSATQLAVIASLQKLTNLVNASKSTDLLTPDGTLKEVSFDSAWNYFSSKLSVHQHRVTRDMFQRAFQELYDEGFMSIVSFNNKNSTSRVSQPSSTKGVKRSYLSGQITAQGASDSLLTHITGAYSRAQIQSLQLRNSKRSGKHHESDTTTNGNDPLHTSVRLLCNRNGEFYDALDEMEDTIPHALLSWMKAK